MRPKRQQASQIGGLAAGGVRAAAAAAGGAAVGGGDEADGREGSEDGAGECRPVAPAEVRVVVGVRRRRAVVAVCEAAERRHGRRLQHHYSRHNTHHTCSPEMELGHIL